MEENKYCVYIHSNKINNKVYIGLTCQKPEYRWGRLGAGYEECPYFWNAIQKYGWDNFSHAIIEENLTHEEAVELEIRLIAEMQSTDPDHGYNLSRGGDGVDPAISKAMWNDMEFKQYVCDKMKEAWKDPAKRARRSQAAKERWSNPDFRSNVLGKVIDACATPVMCVETEETFATTQQAALKYGICRANITRALRTGYLCGGYHWKSMDSVS